MTDEIKNKLTERFNSAYGEEVKIGLREALRKVYLDGAEHGYQYALQHPHWIPVEERLPEVGEKIIFYSPRIDDWLSGALQQDGRWWCEEYGTHFYDVTHWMEIVPPRKEDKE